MEINYLLFNYYFIRILIKYHHFFHLNSINLKKKSDFNRLIEKILGNASFYYEEIFSD